MQVGHSYVSNLILAVLHTDERSIPVLSSDCHTCLRSHLRTEQLSSDSSPEYFELWSAGICHKYHKW